MKAGVKNGMLFGRAKLLCPDLIPISYDFENYQRVSRLLYDTVSWFVDLDAVAQIVFKYTLGLSRVLSLTLIVSLI